ncbi:hypothetical protein EDB81DRAFT_871948 [Dactylonectria macrodidyma]|uniref:Uncharacterized protein n=1 Tax=Dactylonectria macrodidyma TaxID=307937 RepID=A0A9P9DYU5_9HYPO|nr:hypothetical protein EDB81DRAFT_871948 [Dactylonectria macrodidyma]
MTPPSNQKQSDLVGYLGVFFLGDEPSVHFDLSDGNSALSYTPLNGGSPALKPTLGTGGVRDPSIIKGGGGEEGCKWYIIGTDLDISKFNHDWDAASRCGSRSILIWESQDLITWESERLIQIEDATAGMVWAPDALWDEVEQKYLVHWSSHFFAQDDPLHKGNHSNSTIRYAYTTDFVSFSEPRDFIQTCSISVIDLSLLHLGDNAYARFLKCETTSNSVITSYVYMEKSEEGLFGEWNRPDGPDAYICGNSEGPYAWWDNNDPRKAYLLLDDIGLDEPQYVPFEATDFDSQKSWKRSDASKFPPGRRHGSVIGVCSDRFEALKVHYGLATKG